MCRSVVVRRRALPLVVLLLQQTLHLFIETRTDTKQTAPVVDDDRVGRGEVDAEAARARGEDEDELLRAGRVEHLDGVVAVLALGGPVDAAVLVPVMCRRGWVGGFACVRRRPSTYGGMHACTPRGK